jgi:MYXO-CTERM domain-containing protein
MAGNGDRAPEWTDENGPDPGITILQLLPFLALPILGAVLVRRWRRRRRSPA